MRKMISFLIVLIILILVSINTQAQTWFLHRFMIDYSTTLANIDGSPLPQYSTIVIKDRMNYNTCLLVLRDNTTGHFTTTAIHPSSCTLNLGQ